MRRIWFTGVLALLAAYIGGCSSGGSAIYAGAPGAHAPGSYTVRDNGRYTLFKVTEWNKHGQPVRSQELASYDLRSGEKLGFDWVKDPAHMYDVNAHLNLLAYAGGHRVDLGGLSSPAERYFWADAGGWNAYWNTEPAREVTRAVTLQ